MIIIFIGLVIPIFCGNYPESNIHQIFDLFLLDGEDAIITVIFRMLQMKEQKIMELMDADMHHYCKNEFMTEVLSEVKLKVIMKQEMNI
jgi:hypothetical protein